VKSTASRPFPWTVGLLAALGFLLIGRLSLYLLPTEGLAATLFPPAGLGVALVLVHGRAMLPWLGLGSLLLDFSLNGSLDHFQLGDLGLALGLTLAGLMQIGLLAYLLRRFIGYPLSLDSGKKTLTFIGLALGGCLLASSLVSLQLQAAGRLPLDDIGRFWLTWWLGDSLAVLLFTPLLLLYIGTVDPYWRAWRGYLALLTLAGLLLISLAARHIGEMERHEALSKAPAWAWQGQQKFPSTAAMPPSMARHASWQSLLVSLGGLALLSLVNLFVLLANSRAARVESLVAERTRELEHSREQAQHASQLLREAVESIALGFTIYDADDRLLICNQAYRASYGKNADLILPGVPFTEMVRLAAASGQFPAAEADWDAWVRQRLEQHSRADGGLIEERMNDGRWLLRVKYRTPSGYTVGNCIDISQLKQTSEELRQRELYLRATLDNLPFFFWLKDRDSRFLAVNKVFSDACGQPSPEAVVGLSDFDVWPRELAERYRADDARVMDQREVIAVEEPVAGGSEEGWIETYKKPVINDAGEVIGNVGFARDISDRKKIEQQLAQIRQRWELAIVGSNDGIWDWDQQSGKVFYSDRWKSMLGHAPAEIGDSLEEWLNRIHPEDREATLERVQEHLTGRTEFYISEHRLRCKDGSYKWILDRGQALFDAQGKPVRMAGSHTDISERRAAEDRLRDRTEQLNAIFDLSPDGFVSFDAEHRVKYASPAFVRLTGLDKEAIIGLDEAGFAQRLQGACLEEASFPGFNALRDAPRVNAKGSKRHLIELNGAGKRVLQVGLRESAAGTVSQILYFRDVTHEVEVERMKSEFLSTAAHELRTPMASIYGFTELLMMRDFDAQKQKEFYATIFRQSELMITIINELLDLARIEARRGKDFQLQQLDPCRLCAEAVDGFNPPNQRERPLTKPSPCQCAIRGDRNKLIQALGNVLSNAYKYSPEGGPVTIDFLCGGKEGDHAQMFGIQVRDAGIGMTAEQLERVCERFYRADTSGNIPGTGLGMSIVKEILQLHGGDVLIESQVGQGTQVSLWIPTTNGSCP
jgi:PAS domain S-box-containing protein